MTNALKPFDVVVLTALTVRSGPWTYAELAQHLKCSTSQVHASLARSGAAHLYSTERRRVRTGDLRELCVHGLRYVFPVEPGPLTSGLPTAHAGPPLRDHLAAVDLPYVWPWVEGHTKGQAIEPLDARVPDLCARDPAIHELLALIDALRVEGARVRSIATDLLKARWAP